MKKGKIDIYKKKRGDVSGSLIGNNISYDHIYFSLWRFKLP